MSNTEIFFPKKDFIMVKSQSLTLSEPQNPDSSPRHQNLSEDSSQRIQSQREQEHQHVQEQEELVDQTRRKRKREECRVSPLQIPEPSSDERASPEGEYSGEGFETPRSVIAEQRRPDSEEVNVEARNPRCCLPPPAPRKPKAAPATKRRAMWFQSSLVLLDVSREVESMFPPSVLEDFGKKIRKARS